MSGGAAVSGGAAGSGPEPGRDRPAAPELTRRELPTGADTHALGRALADLLVPGDLVVLAGPLGAGKTVLVQGVGAGLGVRGPVTSPTFVLARVHRGGRLPLVHVDAYRLRSVAEVDDLDLDTDLESSVTVVEWGRGMVEGLADDGWLEVRLSRTEGTAGDETRTVELVPHGPVWAARLVAAGVPPGLSVRS